MTIIMNLIINILNLFAIFCVYTDIAYAKSICIGDVAKPNSEELRVISINIALNQAPSKPVYQRLNDPLVTNVLNYLKIKPAKPTLTYLDQLVTAYTRRVPWESASRIAKRSQTLNLEDCPRFECDFWQSAITNGTGGTCFESNNAFFWLLQALGFDAYLTINNMRDQVAVHTAIIIRINGKRYLVDAGFPIHLPVPLNPRKPTYRTTPYHTYFALPGKAPDGATYYRIERDGHPKPYCFTLHDRPVNIDDYRQATTNDYDFDCGLFLDRIIITKVIEDRIWRFGSESAPYQLESFWNGDKTYYFLGYDPAIASDKIAEKFNMNRDIIHTALTTVAQITHV